MTSPTPPSPDDVPFEERQIERGEVAEFVALLRRVARDEYDSGENARLDSEGGRNMAASNYADAAAERGEKLDRLAHHLPALVEAQRPSSVSPSSEAPTPTCTICGATATSRDIDGNWWPPCEHAKANGIETLKYPAAGGSDPEFERLTEAEEYQLAMEVGRNPNTARKFFVQRLRASVSALRSTVERLTEENERLRREQDIINHDGAQFVKGLQRQLTEREDEIARQAATLKFICHLCHCGVGFGYGQPDGPDTDYVVSLDCNDVFAPAADYEIVPPDQYDAVSALIFAEEHSGNPPWDAVFRWIASRRGVEYPTAWMNRKRRPSEGTVTPPQQENGK